MFVQGRRQRLEGFKGLGMQFKEGWAMGAEKGSLLAKF